MKPLLYLFVRSFVNGVKRALTSPRRLIGIIFFFGYYYALFIRPFYADKPRVPGGLSRLDKLGFPSMEYLDAGVFGGFMLISILLSLGVMSYKASFKQADVDVLFPTPVNPKVVMGFRFFRDYFMTLLIPIFLSIVAFRPMAELFSSMIAKDPVKAKMLSLTIGASWLLLALAWVALGYAVTLFVGRSDEQSDRNARIIGWTIATATILTVGYGVFVFKANPSIDALLAILKSPLVRTVFFIPSAATAVALMPIGGSPLFGILGGGVLIALIIIGVSAALSQVGWLYDQASVRGFKTTNIRDMQRKGDMTGVFAEYARQGKIKRGRLATWVSKKTFRGAWALVYKELLLTLRTQVAMLLMFTLVSFVGPAMLLIDSSKRSSDFLPVFYLMITGLTLFSMAIGIAQNGYTETLKRVDLTKPLPFTPASTVFFEVMAKSVPLMILSVLPFLAGFIIRPSIWDFHIAGILLGPSFMLLMCSLSFLVIVLFPDMDDPTQRGFRGIVLLLGMAIVVTPMLGLVATALSLKLPLSPVSLLAVGINFGISALMAIISGRLFADFNPSE